MAEIAGCGLAGIAFWRILLNRPRLSGTTLVSAGRWTAAAAALWLIAWLAPLAVGARFSPAALWCVAGVVSLCPAVAVLGARRPNVRVWTWFVLWPLIAVLAGRSLFMLASDFGPLALELPLPLVLGFAVVLFMGCGNYAPTRYGVSAALFIIAECLIVAPLSETAPVSAAAVGPMRLAATLCLCLAVLMSEYQSRRPTLAPSPLERVWFDFRDEFGIVWARRILDRINDRACTEGWSVRLSDAGWIRAGAADAEYQSVDRNDPRLEQALRWHLRRFVDPDWIDRRMQG